MGLCSLPVSFLAWGAPVLASYSSTLAWKIPWAEERARLQSMGSLRVGHDWATSLPLFTFVHWRRKWQPTPAFLPGESQGREPGGLPSMGSHRIRHDWSDLVVVMLIYHSENPRTLRITLNLLFLCSVSGTRKPWWPHICWQHGLQNILSPLLRSTA